MDVGYRKRKWIPWDNETTFDTYANLYALSCDVAQNTNNCFTPDDVATLLYRVIGYVYGKSHPE